MNENPQQPSSGEQPQPPFQGAPPPMFEAAPQPSTAAPLTTAPAFEAVGRSWRKAWELVKAEPVSVPLAGLIAAVLGGLTFGILTGALSWGVLAMCFQRMRTSEPIQVQDVFSQFKRFGTSLGIAFLGGLAVTVGLILLVIPGLYLAVILMYALPLGLDQKLGVMESFKASQSAVNKSGFWLHAAILGSLLLTGMIISAVTRYAGGLIGYAIAIPVLAAAYELYIKPLSATRAG